LKLLKQQIKQFSSARYQISGPLSDPEVKLVGIWNDDIEAFDELPPEPGGLTPATEGGL